MPPLIVDASALLAVLLGEPHRGGVIEAAQGARLLAAGSLPWEMGNALGALVRRDRIGPQHAADALARFEEVPIQLDSVSLHVALGLALEEGIYAYDAYVLALAEHRRAPVLTVDLRLRAVARRRGVPVRPGRLPGDERFA